MRWSLYFARIFFSHWPGPCDCVALLPLLVGVPHRTSSYCSKKLRIGLNVECELFERSSRCKETYVRPLQTTNPTLGNANFRIVHVQRYRALPSPVTPNTSRPCPIPTGRKHTRRPLQLTFLLFERLLEDTQPRKWFANRVTRSLLKVVGALESGCTMGDHP